MDEKKKVLIIDDDQGVCLVVQHALEATGEFVVIASNDIQAAESLCVREQPNLLLLDNIFPGSKRGSDVVKILKGKEETKNIPIIILSGKGEMIYSPKKQKFDWLPNNPVAKSRGEIVEGKDPAVLAKAYGVDDYIAKPFTNEILLEVIRDVLKKRAKLSESQNP